MTISQRVLTVVGDPNDINTWSNIPYFFLKAGQEAGFLDQGLPLQPNQLKLQRLLWNGWQLLTTGEKGGFQYSKAFCQALFSQANAAKKPIEIISHFPLLPPQPWPPHWQISYYIDATTKQVFEAYGTGSQVSAKVRKKALLQEALHYQHARRIICMSPWAAQSVIQDYGVLPKKVHVIPGGANLPETALPQMAGQILPNLSLTPLRLGFVGKDWQRKGLPMVLQVADVLLGRGIAVEVFVAGPARVDLPDHPAITSLGFIDKARDLPEYVRLVQSFHFGCLFSQAEAFGISNLECLRLGVPVLASRTGGIPATVPEGLGYLFAPGTSPTVVADLLESFVRQPATYVDLRQRVSARATEFSWRATVQRFIDLWEQA